MSATSDGLVLVIGVGNPDRGDDAAGLLAAQYIRVRTLPGVIVLEHPGEGIDLMNLWQREGLRAIYVIDAMSSGCPPGTIERFETQEASLPAQFSGSQSTHVFGVAEAVELARALDCLPRHLVVYGIEGGCFDAGAPLSPEVRAAYQRAANQVIAEAGFQMIL
jgi:hydrogenase maturation protease